MGRSASRDTLPEVAAACLHRPCGAFGARLRFHEIPDAGERPLRFRRSSPATLHALAPRSGRSRRHFRGGPDLSRAHRLPGAPAWPESQPCKRPRRGAAAATDGPQWLSPPGRDRRNPAPVDGDPPPVERAPLCGSVRPAPCWQPPPRQRANGPRRRAADPCQQPTGSQRRRCARSRRSGLGLAAARSRTLILAAVPALAMVATTGLAVSSAAAPCEGPERARAVMGTLARVVVCDPVPGDGAAEAASAALDAIERVDRVMSLYRRDSDLSRLNREGYPGPVPLDVELLELLEQAQSLGRQTGGRFDITIKPLMDHYGFYKDLGFLPPEGGLAGALSRVGYGRLVVDRSAGSCFFRAPGMGVDLGGIAKGYALDRAAAALRQRGVRRGYLDLGRELLLVGEGTEAGGRWNVGIVDPLEPDALAEVIAVPEGAVSTSALFGRSASGRDGRVGHILDPARGLAEKRVLQATVWSRSATRADALSTALIL